MPKVDVRLKDEQVQGRVDVLAYHISRSAIELLEKKLGVKLWDMMDEDIEILIKENIPSEKIVNDSQLAILRVMGNAVLAFQKGKKDVG